MIRMVDHGQVAQLGDGLGVTTGSGTGNLFLTSCSASPLSPSIADLRQHQRLRADSRQQFSGSRSAFFWHVPVTLPSAPPSRRVSGVIRRLRRGGFCPSTLKLRSLARVPGKKKPRRFAGVPSSLAPLPTATAHCPLPTAPFTFMPRGSRTPSARPPLGDHALLTIFRECSGTGNLCLNYCSASNIFPSHSAPLQHQRHRFGNRQRLPGGRSPLRRR